MPLNIDKIRNLMGERSLSEVAAAAKMAQPNLSRILSGKFDPKLSTVERLAMALGKHVKDILTPRPRGGWNRQIRKEDERLLGTDTDSKIAELLGVSRNAVSKRRIKLKIPIIPDK